MPGGGGAVHIAACPPQGDWSFPSNHATIAAASAAAIVVAWRVMAPLVLPLAALMAFSRVFVGVHYPHDVAAGFLLGVVVAPLVGLVLVRVLRPLVESLRGVAAGAVLLGAGPVAAPGVGGPPVGQPGLAPHAGVAAAWCGSDERSAGRGVGDDAGRDGRRDAPSGPSPSWRRAGRAVPGWCSGAAGAARRRFGTPRRAGAGGVRWVDEVGFVGEDGGLDAVADVQAGEDGADVGLDGAFGEVEAGGDLGVGQACAEEGEDVAFARGEVAVRWRARARQTRSPPPIWVMTRWATFGDR